MTAHRLRSESANDVRYLYRGFVITRIDGSDGVWWHYDDDRLLGRPLGGATLDDAKGLVDKLYEDGFVHRHEGPLEWNREWSSKEYQEDYWG